MHSCRQDVSNPAQKEASLIGLKISRLGDNLSDLCHYSYQQSSSECMKELQKHGGGRTAETADSESRQ